MTPPSRTSDDEDGFAARRLVMPYPSVSSLDASGQPSLWTWSKPDWGFYSDQPNGPDIFRSYENWWDAQYQDRFDRLWSTEADAVADDLADRYWFAWPWLVGRALATSAPQTAEQIKAFAADPDRRGPHSYGPEAMADSIATWGSFHVVRRRRTWLEPSTGVCPLCNTEFWTGHLSTWTFRQFGPARYCEYCCKQARGYPAHWRRPSADRYGHPIPSWSRPDVTKALRELSAAFEAVPSQAFALQALPHAASDEQRDTWMRALVAMPTVETVKEVLGVKDWLGALEIAGLVEDGWRPSLGTWCRAQDGHRCRSLLEKSIDDWLTSRGIAHECEPYWPRHPELNPSGRKRADWILPDGSYVECAGLMEKPDYVTKIGHKRELARVLGIPLLIVGPTDLLRLDQIFVSYLAGR